jgi:hypothetical protein
MIPPPPISSHFIWAAASVVYKINKIICMASNNFPSPILNNISGSVNPGIK